MANAFFTVFRNNVWTPQTGFDAVDVDADTLKLMFVDHTDDTPAAATDQDIADIASGGRIPAIASCPTLGSVTVGTVGAGVFDAADATFTSLTGDQAESLILFKDTGVEASSILIAVWDTITGLPLTPNGGNVTVTINASGIGSF